MSFKKLAIAAGLIACAAVPAMAQEQDQSRGATPRNLPQWAGQIQQDYPAEALRNELEGRVTMRIRIGADGTAESCEVTGSSDAPSLDEAACRGMLEYARYNPALDADGNPTASTTTQSIRYVLPEGGPSVPFKSAIPDNPAAWRDEVFDAPFVEAIARAKRQAVLYFLTIDEEGRPTGCGAMVPSGDAALDRSTCAALLEHARFLPLELENGENVPGVYPVAYPSFEEVSVIR